MRALPSFSANLSTGSGGSDFGQASVPEEQPSSAETVEARPSSFIVSPAPPERDARRPAASALSARSGAR